MKPAAKPKAKTKRTKSVAAMTNIMEHASDGRPWIKCGKSPLPTDLYREKSPILFSDGACPCISYRLTPDEKAALVNGLPPLPKRVNKRNSTWAYSNMYA